MNFRKMIRKVKLHNPISIGMRTFKTWIAATVTATIALTPIIGNPLYALMGTVFGMQNTVSNSFKMGLGRIIGTVVGAFIGFIFAYFELSSPPVVGFAIVLVILTCGFLKINHTIFITITLCLLIMFNPTREGGLLRYTVLRTIDTSLGVVVGFLVNRFIWPPNHLKALVTELEYVDSITRKALTDNSKLPELREALSTLALIHKNYQADEKYDNHDVSNENLRQTNEACNDLYFHFKNSQVDDPTIKDYHINKIYKTLDLLENTLDALKGVI